MLNQLFRNVVADIWPSIPGCAFSGLCVALLGQCRATFAWGADGHKVIGSLAYHYVSDDTKAALKELLGDMTLSDAGLWADDVRNHPGYEWAKPLHFVNVRLDATSYDAARDCSSGQCVVAAIEKYRAIVADKPKPRDGARRGAEMAGALRR